MSDAYNKSGSFGALAYTYVTNSNLIADYTNSKVKVEYAHHANRDVVTSVTNQELVGTPGTLSSFSYSLNTLGQRTSLTLSGTSLTTAGTWTYSYNDRGELTGADHSVETTNDLEYLYDAIGNRDWTKKNGVTTN